MLNKIIIFHHIIKDIKNVLLSNDKL